jgi:hypothetical protein
MLNLEISKNKKSILYSLNTTFADDGCLRGMEKNEGLSGGRGGLCGRRGRFCQSSLTVWNQPHDLWNIAQLKKQSKVFLK